MPSRATSIIRTLYGREISRSRGVLSRGLRPLTAEERLVAAHGERVRMRFAVKVALVAAVVLAGALMMSSAYYFNQLTRVTQNIGMEAAIIDSISQRRRHISINLARTLRDYAVHEREVLTHVADARASSLGAPPGKPDAAPPSDDASRQKAIEKILAGLEGSPAGPLALEGQVSKLLGVAESYPDLKLSENFRVFMTALIATEKDLNDEIIKYSVQVNAYTTLLKTVPSRWFAWLFGFRTIAYWPLDAESKRFQPVDY